MLIVNEMMLVMIAPPTCIPSRAKMKMKRKRRRRRDMMEDKAFISAITRFRSGDQYLKMGGQQKSGKDLNFKTGSELEKAWKLQPSIRALTLQCPLPLT